MNSNKMIDENRMKHGNYNESVYFIVYKDGTLIVSKI